MFYPKQRFSYRMNIPLTEKEKSGHGSRRKKIQGVFKYIGRVKGKLLFRGNLEKVDGVLYAGDILLLTPEEFDLGCDLGKIRGEAKRVKTAA